ncbi:hypothetical protein HDV00_000891 [Rhizophlyctis rosea]|nr:hypothetical protein HDV00_000891 [Rhizophlyctis rosea]
MLQAASPFFEAMFANDKWKESSTKTVELPLLTPRGVEIAVQLMYTGSRDLPESITSLDWPQSFQACIDIQNAMTYFIFTPPPGKNAVLRHMRHPLDKQDSQTQIDAWKEIHEAQNGDCIDMMISYLGRRIRPLRALGGLGGVAEATVDVHHLIRILRKARKSGVAMEDILGCADTWVKGYNGDDKKGMLFDELANMRDLNLSPWKDEEGDTSGEDWHP